MHQSAEGRRDVIEGRQGAAIRVSSKEPSGARPATAAGAPSASHSLNSSSSSFFSLAHSTGFCHLPSDAQEYPYTSSSGGRGTTVSDDAVAVAAVVPGASVSHREEKNGWGGSRVSQTTVAHPKASRPRLTQPLSPLTGPGFATISTRGSTVQSTHAAFNDSPPPSSIALPSFGSNSPAPAAAAAPSRSGNPHESRSVPDVLKTHGGLFTSFGTPPQAVLAHSTTAAELQRMAPLGGHAGVRAAPTAGFVVRSTAATPVAVRHGIASPSAPSNGAACLTPLCAGPGVARGAAEVPLDGADKVRSTAQSATTPTSDAHAEAPLVSSTPSAALTSPLHHLNSSALQPPRLAQAPVQVHRYHEADEEQAAAAAAAANAVATEAPMHSGVATPPPPPPPLPTPSPSHPPQRHAAPSAVSAATPPPSAPPPPVSSPNRPEKQHRSHPVRLSAEQLSKLPAEFLQRRTSVSAAPYVPAAWRAGPQVRGALNDKTGIASTSLRTHDGSRSVVTFPLRPTFTPPENRSGHLTATNGPVPNLQSALMPSSSSNASTATTATSVPNRPSVRFIYTRSGSSGKIGSPDRPVSEVHLNVSAAAPPALALSAATTADKDSALATAAAAAPLAEGEQKSLPLKKEATTTTFVTSSLRRSSAPLQPAAPEARRPSASVPFTRSATHVGVSAVAGREAQETQRRRRSEVPVHTEKVDGARRAESTCRPSGRTSSNKPPADFDAAPQSYLEKWRQRQEERRRLREGGTSAVKKEEGGKSQQSADVVPPEIAPASVTVVEPVPAPDVLAAAPEATPPPPPPASAAAVPIAHPDAAATASIQAEATQPQSSAATANASLDAQTQVHAFTATTASDIASPSKEKAQKTPMSHPTTATDPSVSHSGYTLSEALRDSAIPDTVASVLPNSGPSAHESPYHYCSMLGGTAQATLSLPLASVVDHSAAPATAEPPVVAVSVLIPATPTTNAEPAAAAVATAAAPLIDISGGPTTTSAVLVAAPAAAAMSPTHSHSSPNQSSSSQARRFSHVSSSSYLTEGTVHRDAAEEAIPEEQVVVVAAAAAVTVAEPPKETEADAPPAAERCATSPRRPAKAEATVDSEYADPQAVHAEGPATRATSALRSSRASILLSARRNTVQLPSSRTASDRDGGTPSVRASTSEVRDLCQAVLRRREQRLQRLESARTSIVGSVAPPLPRASPDGVVQSHVDAGDVPTTAAAEAVTDATRNSTTLPEQASARRIRTPYTPPWKAGIFASSSRPLSALPEHSNGAAEGKAVTIPAATPTTLMPSRAVTPVIGSAASQLNSVPSTAILIKSAVPSRSLTPSPGLGSACLAPDGPPSVLTAALDTETADPVVDEAEQRSHRISQLLARRASFASRLSPAGAATTTTASSATHTPFESRTGSAAAAVQLAEKEADAAPSSSARRSTRVTGSPRPSTSALKRRGSPTASSDVNPAASSFSMATAMESIPTAAQIEREALQARAAAAERQELVDKCRRPASPAPDPEGPATVPAARATESVSKNGSSAAPSKTATVVRTSPAPQTEAKELAAKPSLQPSTAATSKPSPPPPPPPSQPPSQLRAAKEKTSAPTTPPPVTPLTSGTPLDRPAVAAAPLGDIRLDDLDKLEQSVNAMLQHYGVTVQHATPAKDATSNGGTPGKKMTAADALLRHMPEPAKTTTVAKLGRKSKSTAPESVLSHKKASSMEMSGSSSAKLGSSRRTHGYTSDMDDEDYGWDATVLWCGEESDSSPIAPPITVPMLDLSSLQLPTGDPGDLKPYRIPLPSAVPALDEARRRLLQAAGLLPASPLANKAGGEASQDGDPLSVDGLASNSTSSLSINHQCSNSSSSSPQVSQVVGERIRRMKEQPTEPSEAATTAAAARRLRASRRASASVAAAETEAGGAQKSSTAQEMAGGHRNGSSSSSRSSEEDDRAAEESIREIVDEAPQRVARVVRFTDDSDALDGGRGADRDMRVGQQKSRVQCVLLDCDEIRGRKALVKEEQADFLAISKHFRRQSLLTS